LARRARGGKREAAGIGSQSRDTIVKKAAREIAMTIQTHEDGYHWQVMRRAIDLIDAANGADIPLDRLAADLGLSPAHVQRVFTRFVGVSPKRYQQFLALGHARAMLRDRMPVLAAADAAGLSGGGRLHDLFLRWEAMTPGDYARRGAGLTIRQGVFDSPFGPVVAMGTDRGICGLGFAAETGVEAARADLAARWPLADFVDDPGPLAPWVAAAFGQGPDRVPLAVIGAPFQIKVWEALVTIPSGQVTTYSDIAEAIGHPRAMRAVGAAVGRNPISLLIPCHRVIARSGALTGYHWGLPVKRALLAWETAQDEQAARGAPGP
jgi:AraC family transcriptional regulator of adaptative response/methylated-DNA-[protein]-cysteine methyltransferase